MFNCLMNTGGRPISSEAAEVLLRAACEMAQNKKKRLKVNAASCEGLVSTQWKHSSMGTISGIEFLAEVVLKTGETSITFLMRNFDLDFEGEWGFAPLSLAEQMVAAEERAARRPNAKLN